jgi:Predicted rRNA methylase
LRLSNHSSRQEERKSEKRCRKRTKYPCRSHWDGYGICSFHRFWCTGTRIFTDPRTGGKYWVPCTLEKK